MGNFHSGSPNQALVKSGFSGSHISVGKTAFQLWICQQVRSLSLELLTIEINSVNAETNKGVRVSVKGVAQVKVAAYKNENGKRVLDTAKILLAAQHFLGDTEENIKLALQRTMEGHQRQILGTLTVENLYKDRQAFAEQVRTHVLEDLSNMGFGLASYVVQKITDENGYMESLGVTQTALVKRQAAEGKAKNESESRKQVATFEADAKTAEAEEFKRSHVAVNEQKERKEESDRDLKLKQAEFEREVNQANAEAKNAGTIELMRQHQLVIREKTLQTMAEEEVKRDIAEQRMLRAMKEKDGESMAFLLEQQNKAKQILLRAEAEAAEARAIGFAEAEVVRMKGEAEAKVLADKAKAYKAYGDAAVVQMIVERLPEIASSMSQPLSKTQKMTFVSSDGSGPSQFTNDVSRMVGHVPSVVQSLTGFDMRQAVQTLTHQNQQITAAL